MSGVVLNGQYYPDGAKLPPTRTNTQYKNWSMDEQRRIHARDIIQAHKGGKPNPSFIREYQEEAKRYFTPEEIRIYGNSYE